MALMSIKDEWNKEVSKISSKRNWTELKLHFIKHINEMENIDSIKEPERAINKAWSLLDLCAFAIKKMKVSINYDDMNYEKMLSRIIEHKI